MKIKVTEQKLRTLLAYIEKPLGLAKANLENNNWTTTDAYKQTIEAIRLKKELEQEIGLLEDRSEGKLKQVKMFTK